MALPHSPFTAASPAYSPAHRPTPPSPTFDVRCWMFDVRCWMFDVRCWMFDVRCWMFDVRCWMFDVRCCLFRSFLESGQGLVTPLQRPHAPRSPIQRTLHPHSRFLPHMRVNVPL